MGTPTSIKDRAFTALNLKQFSRVNNASVIGVMRLKAPKERQYVLRMLIKRPNTDIMLPPQLEWLRGFVNACVRRQEFLGIRQPFMYITVRNGIVDSETDDEWHIDGFSTRITHLPEQNYVWSNYMGTEYVQRAFDFPIDFDPLKHNVNKYIAKQIQDNEVYTMENDVVYALDPYIPHRRPPQTKGVERCFLRLSFTPIEIEDVNNTYNILLPTDYKRDGVKEMRNLLKEYHGNS